MCRENTDNGFNFGLLTHNSLVFLNLPGPATRETTEGESGCCSGGRWVFISLTWERGSWVGGDSSAREEIAQRRQRRRLLRTTTVQLYTRPKLLMMHACSLLRFAISQQPSPRVTLRFEEVNRSESKREWARESEFESKKLNHAH